jgi:PleD family two-component response regulator
VGDAQGLFGLADNLLYQAKHTGRGRVCGGVMVPEDIS